MARGESGGSRRVSRASLDASGDESASSAGGDDGGALDALWRFEEAHHFRLNQQLAPAHAAFVDDLYAALEAAREALEQQSVRVLAVLHDKDTHIQALEVQAAAAAAARSVKTVETATQATPRAKHQATQSDAAEEEENEEKAALLRQVDEQGEQIEVLLDELERVQENKQDAQRDNLERQRSNTTPRMDSQATQTDTDEQLEEGRNLSRGSDAWTTVTELRSQLDEAERRNSELLSEMLTLKLAVQAPPLPPPQTVKPDEISDLDALEAQLHDAIRAMAASSQCCLNPLVSRNDSAMTACFDLDHKLQAVALERDALADEVLALREALTKSAASRSFSTALVRVPSVQNSPKADCTQVTCHHTLRRILRLIREQRPEACSARDGKSLRREIRHALRGHNENQATSFVARVVAEWMCWEAAHVEEVASLHRAHEERYETQSVRVANLVDEIYRLNQRVVDLETELKVLSRQRKVPLPADIQGWRASPTDTVEGLVESDRRVLILEQSLALKQEQLDLANRAVRALSSGVGSQALSVRFADQDINSGQELVQHRSSLPASSAKSLIAELTTELQAQRERDFRRFQPANTSQHAVVEYFRLEKECLRLRCRLKDKDDRIQQLELQCEQLEKSARRSYTSQELQEAWAAAEGGAGASTSASEGIDQANRRTVERYYLRVLEKRNEDLSVDVTNARSQIVLLERTLKLAASSHPQSGDSTGSGSSHLIEEIAVRVGEYHNQALIALRTWQHDILHFAHSSNAVDTGTKERTRSDVGQPDALFASYGVLLAHYETLTLQLRLLSNACASEPVSRTDESSCLPRDWQLLERIHALEDRLLEAKVCLGCGAEIVKKISVKTKDTSTTTVTFTTVEAGTQMSSRDRQRLQVSKGVQIDLETVPFQFEESRDQDTSHKESAPHSSLAGIGRNPLAMVSDEQRAAVSDSRLQEIQDKLNASLARIEELASQKEKLKQRLDEARQANRRNAQERDSLRSRVAELESSNASFSNESRQLRQAHPSTVSNEPNIPFVDTLAVKEQENRELVRQLCEMKQTCFELEKLREDAHHRIRTVEQELKDSEADRVEERNRYLEEYMTKVNQSLASIERDKERLTRENQALQRKLQQIETDAAIREAKGTRSCATETDSVLETDRLLQLPEHQALETRVVMLQNELENERRACAELRDSRDAEQREKTRILDAERATVEESKSTLRSLIEDITTAHESLQREVMELQAASAEAKEEADKRIHFLTACVEECSRLVDATGPNDEIVTARDIYDTIVTLSTKVATTASSPATTTPRRSKAAALAKASDKKPSAQSARAIEPAAPRTEAAHGFQVHSQLQAETWLARVTKLELSLRAANLKNKTFEDMIDHLEVQMDALKGEVKDRMTKESTLLTKQGQMKVEIANLKTQNGTLTSRLAEACAELKRSQDASKGTDGEIARLRTALQRKTELHSRQKAKYEDTQKALDQATKRIAQLEGAEKSFAAALLKQKDQALQLQELRQQCAVSRDANFELRAQVDKQKEQLSELQSRVKALRIDNGQLRDQLRGLKKAMREEAESAYKSHAADTATAAAAVVGDGKTPANLTPTAAVDMLAAQVKTLKRRVLQKQEVIVAYKTKLSELDAELVLQRTKLFDFSQSYRQLQQAHREKEQSMLHGATHLKDALEASLLERTEQLDGLRASIYDACEVFVQCEPVPMAVEKTRRPESSLSSADSLTWPEDNEDDDTDAQLLLELRRYADLSPADLADLGITSPRRAKPTKPAPLDAAHAAHVARQRGARALLELEHALEVAPHDCREEICAVLQFLSARKGDPGPVARRY